MTTTYGQTGGCVLEEQSIDAETLAALKELKRHPMGRGSGILRRRIPGRHRL